MNFTVPVARDNSGAIARMEVIYITPAGRFDGFHMPWTTFEDITVEYYAFDFDGNVAICQVCLQTRRNSYSLFFFLLCGCVCGMSVGILYGKPDEAALLLLLFLWDVSWHTV